MLFTTSSRPLRLGSRLIISLMMLIVLTALNGCIQPVLPNVVNDIKARGELRVAIQYEPNRYEIGPQGKTGFDYDLVAGFADHLGVDLVITPYYAAESMQQSLADGDVDILVFGSRFREQTGIKRRLGPRYLDTAWQLNHQQDDSLLAASYDYFSLIRQQNLINTLQSRYLQKDNTVKPPNVEKFVDLAEPRLAALASRYADQNKLIPWTLLAALTYQLGGWQNEADDLAAARRFIAVTRQVPARVPAASKVPMSLAAYYSGISHLLDARRLTRRQGGDENDWLDVRQRYPLLADENVFKHTHSGYTNGTNAVEFVSNVLTYQRALEALAHRSR